MIKKLTEVWGKCQTMQLAMIFENYMKSIGARKFDRRRKDNTNTYMVDGKSTGWNRVECFYYKDSTEYGEQNLLLVLRKKAGDYFIVGSKSDRAFEVDYSGLRHCDEALLKEIMEEHKLLFDTLLKEAS